MNNEYFIEKLGYYLLIFIIPILLYFTAKKIVSKTKYFGNTKTILQILIMSLLCFLLFMFYGHVLIGVFNIRFKILTPVGFILGPISLFCSVIFLIIFLSQKKR